MTHPDLFTQVVQPDMEKRSAEFLERARATAEHIATHTGTVNVDQVRECCPPPDGVDPRLMGSIFRDPKFRLVGYEKSTRKECHQRPIGVFELTEEPR